jgi:hypothetical protein
MSDKKCHAIREVKKYMDDSGREVLEFVQVFGKDKDPDIVKGAVMIRVGMMSPNGQAMPPQTIRLEFLFDEGTSVKAAFDTFDAVAQSEVDKWKKEQEEHAKAARVVGAKAMPKIIGPDGRPM